MPFASGRVPTSGGLGIWVPLPAYLMANRLGRMEFIGLIVAFVTVFVLLRNFKGIHPRPACFVTLDCRDEKWYGRNGNNMLSVFHGALFAYSKGCKFSIASCQHEFLVLAYLGQSAESQLSIKSGNLNNEIITPTTGFYLYINSSKLDDMPFSIYRQTLPYGAGCHRISTLFPMVQHLAVGNNYYDDDSNLIISVRSGDVFLTDQRPPAIYTPAPLSFYIDIITNFDSNVHPLGEIIIVSEVRNLSPIAIKLAELYPERVKLQTGTLEEDSLRIFGAKNLVLSPSSTFAWALGMASKKLKRLYSFDNQLQTLDVHGFSGVHVEEYYVDEYIKAWENTPEQVEYLLKFPAFKLKKKVLDISKCSAAWTLAALG